MPDNQQPGLLQRLFGSSEMTPDMQQAVGIARGENPNLAPVQPYGLLARIFGGGDSQGWTSPGGTIYLNPNQLQNLQPQAIADTITHENVHATQKAGIPAPVQILRQMFGNTASTPYGQRPEEMAAFQAERERRAKTGRTGVPSVYPSFMNPGQEYTNQDTYLPTERRR